MMYTLRRVVAAGGLAWLGLLAGGCASLPDAATDGAAAAWPRPSLPEATGSDPCARWWRELDAAVFAAGVADAEAERIQGFAGLRVDRIGQALLASADSDTTARAAWMHRSAELDRQAREAELAQLPAAAFPVGAALDRAAALSRSRECRESQVQTVLQQPARWRQLAAVATVPPRYSRWHRALGAYALLRWPFWAGVQAWQDGHQAEMARWREQAPPLQRWLPPREGAGDAALAAPRGDALGLPRWTEPQARQWLAWHAPELQIETRGRFDRIGSPRWAPTDGPPGTPTQPDVNEQDPVVYQRLSHTRWQGRWLPQLVYTIWFAERPARSRFDLLAGRLDGLILRLTLDEDGQPLLLDSIHACGCYHLFFPSARLRERTDGPRHEEWLFAPQPLPRPGPGERLVLRVASASHYLMGVTTNPREPRISNSSPQQHYRLADENELRALPGPVPEAPRRSLYASDGLVQGSERGERWLFWPMGIRSAGAMRQWGHHATAFVGRRHFDDVDLLEQRFERVPER